jgi:hypothetical protein
VLRHVRSEAQSFRPVVSDGRTANPCALKVGTASGA